MTTEPRENKDNRKRAVAIGLVGLGVVGLAAASAATLSVTTAGSDDLAAGSANVVVEGPGTQDVTVSFAPSGTLPMAWNLNDTRTVDVTVTGLSGSMGGNVHVAVYAESLDGTPAPSAVPLWQGNATIADDQAEFTTSLTGAQVFGDAVNPSVSVIVTDA
jgi:hypothetical protein